MKRLLIILSALFAAAAGASAQNAALSTNIMGYANLGTLNMEASYAIAQHWSLNAGLKYNPFTFRFSGMENEVQARQREVNIGARFWPWHVYSGWWVAGKAQYQEYNMGGYKTAETSEGDRYGGGLTAGYSHMLGRHFNVEAGVGGWAGMDRYVRYSCPTCGRIVDEGNRFFLLLNDILLSVTYVF